jgi:hypothetical protein
VIIVEAQARNPPDEQARFKIAQKGIKVADACGRRARYRLTPRIFDYLQNLTFLIFPWVATFIAHRLHTNYDHSRLDYRGKRRHPHNIENLRLAAMSTLHGYAYTHPAQWRLHTNCDH